MSIKKRIKILEKQRNALLHKLLGTQHMLRGTLGITYRKCGKPNCWCANESGHPYCRITWSENSQSKTRAIPQADANKVEDLTQSYRIFKENRKALREINKKIKLLFDQFENQIVDKTRKQSKIL